MNTKMKLLVSILAFGIIVQTNAVYGQTKLPDLMQYALEHSRDVKKSKLQVREAQYLRKEVIGQGLPQVEASGTYTKMMLPEISLPEGLTSMVPEQYAPMLAKLSDLDALYTTSAGIQITQLIYSQSYLTGLKTTKKTQDLYNLLQSKTEEDVLEEVANGYYQTFSLMLQQQTVSKSLVNLKEIYRIAELNYRNDLLKESSVNRLKVTITNLEANEQTLKNVIDIQLNYLKALTGMPADSALSIDTASLNNNLTTNLNIAFSVENVPSYKLLLKQDELNIQQVKMARAKYAPTLAAFGKLSYSSYNTEPEIKKFTNMNTIGLQLSVPIFSSGVNHSKVKQAQLRKSQSEEAILKTKDLLNVSYTNALSEYQTAYRLLDVQRENRDLAFKVYNQTASQYKEGMASMADLLNVNSEFLQADNSYNQQILKYKLSEIKMMKSSGNIKQLVNNK